MSVDGSKKKSVKALSFEEMEATDARTPEPNDDSDDPHTDIPDKPSSVDDLESVFNVHVRVSAVLGRSSMKVAELVRLGRGAVIELDRKVGEAIDVYVNNRMIARGEVVVINDRLGITMTEIIKSQKT